MGPFYTSPATIAPLGSSDHRVVKWYPCYTPNTKSSNACKQPFRRFSLPARHAFGRWLASQNWSSTDENITTEDLACAFTHKLSQASDTFFPMKVGKLHSSDKPWMTASLKKLIQLRQRAFHDDNPDLWHHYRDKVKREII